MATQSSEFVVLPPSSRKNPGKKIRQYATSMCHPLKLPVADTIFTSRSVKLIS